MRQGVLISTTEHLLSVFYSMGVDNAYVEIDNLEVPILDGSGSPYVELLRAAGLKSYRRRKRFLRIRRPVTVEAGSKRITILPSDRFLLTCDVFYDHPLIGKQSLDMEVTPERYAQEIAPARTFGFAHELAQMRDMGLIRGASLENAICFDRNGVQNPEGLRFPDECCRHKALDLIGDLALIGKPLLGHVIAERAGHAMHTALVARIMSDPSLYEILSFDQLATRVAHALVSQNTSVPGSFWLLRRTMTETKRKLILVQSPEPVHAAPGSRSFCRRRYSASSLRPAIVLFFLAGVSDVIDGFLARRFRDTLRPALTSIPSPTKFY